MFVDTVHTLLLLEMVSFSLGNANVCMSEILTNFQQNHGYKGSKKDKIMRFLF